MNTLDILNAVISSASGSVPYQECTALTVMDRQYGHIEQAENKNKFFRLPGIFWLIFVPLGLALLTATMLAPQSVPYDMLGPVGYLAKMLAFKYPSVLRGIFYTAWILHSFEAIYAFSVARSKNLCTRHVWLWSMETLFYGVFAMKYLLSYEPSKQKTT